MLKHRYKYKVSYVRYTGSGENRRVKVETLIMYASSTAECRQRISDVEAAEYPEAEIKFGTIKMLGRGG